MQSIKKLKYKKWTNCLIYRLISKIKLPLQNSKFNSINKYKTVLYIRA